MEARAFNHRPDFVQFGDIRIKLSNIKNYGLNVEKKYYLQVYRRKPFQKRTGLFNIFTETAFTYVKCGGMKEEIPSWSAEALLREVSTPKKVFIKKGEFLNKEN